MEKKNYLVVVLIAILFFIIGNISGYFICNSDKETSGIIGDDNKETSMEAKINQLKKENGTLEKYFNEYISFIPIKYDAHTNLLSYTVNDLTDKDISMAVWRYIYKINNGFSENGISTSKVNEYIENYLGLTNYEVKLMEESDEHAFGLSKDNNKYHITAWATEFSFASFEVNKVNYDLNKNTVSINGNNIYYEMDSNNKIIENVINLELKYNDKTNSFQIVKFDVIN